MKDFKIKTLIELLNDKLSYANLEYKFVDMVQIDDGNERTFCLVSDRPGELDMVAVNKVHFEDELTEMLWSILHRVNNLIELLRIYDQFKSNRLEIDLNSLSGTCVKEQYYRGYYNVANIIIIRSDGHGLNMKLIRKFPYETMGDSIKTCNVRTPDCESKEFSSGTVVVNADNFQTVIRLLTQQVMQEFQTSEFRKQLQNKNGH